MAAFQLLSSPSFSENHRMNKGYFSMQSSKLQKEIRFFSVCLQKQYHTIKLYIIPVRAIACQFTLRASASVVSASDSYQRSETSYKLSDDMEEFDRQLKELLNEVRTMILNGHKDDAVDLLQANYEYVEEQLKAGAKGIGEAAILDVVALGYFVAGDLKIVDYILVMLSEIVGSLEDGEPLMDSILVHMGSMYSTLEKFQKSMLMYQRAVDIIEKKYGKDSTFLVTPILGMAKVLSSLGRASKALQIYERAITILESSRGKESEDLVVPLFNLGNLLLREGKTVDAEASFVRILNIYTELYGEEDGRVGMAMCSLAHVKCADGKVDEAIILYKKALQVIRNSKYIALDDSIMERLMIDLAELLHVVRRGTEGRELLEECLLITEKYKGKEDPSYVKHLMNLAISYSRSKNFVEAERLLTVCLDIMRKTIGPDDQSITFPMLQLAVTLFNLNRDEEAEQLALEVLRMREKAFGEDSLLVGEAMDCLVSIKGRQGKDEEEVVELLKRILRIQEREFGEESEEVMVTLKKIVFYFDRLGMKDDKYPLQRRLSLLRMKFKHRIQY